MIKPSGFLWVSKPTVGKQIILPSGFVTDVNPDVARSLTHIKGNERMKYTLLFLLLFMIAFTTSGFILWLILLIKYRNTLPQIVIGSSLIMCYGSAITVWVKMIKDELE